MKEIVVLSGKGGTGKTTLLAALAHLAANEGRLVLADADVDAANLGLVLEPRLVSEHEFLGGNVAVVDALRCLECGTCLEACRFDAIAREAERPNGQARLRVNPIACEGCAACYYRCPEGAITMEPRVAGRWCISQTRFGTMVQADLFAGQENSGKLVMEVKQQARELARGQGADYLMIDGPPGIGCPVISACSGADLALLVAEPTVAGLHDLERILATVRHFKVPALVSVNKFDLSPARCHEVEQFCRAHQVEVAGRIPFDTAVTEAMVRRQTITEWAERGQAGDRGGARAGGKVAEAIGEVWHSIRQALVTAHTAKGY